MKYIVELNFKTGMVVSTSRKFDRYKEALRCMEKYINIMSREENNEIGITKVSLHVEAA